MKKIQLKKHTKEVNGIHEIRMEKILCFPFIFSSRQSFSEYSLHNPVIFNGKFHLQIWIEITKYQENYRNTHLFNTLWSKY